MQSNLNATFQNTGVFVGVDGCRAGWCVAVYRDGRLQFKLIGSIEDIVAVFPLRTHVFIDMPIGLTDLPEGRLCEMEAKQFLPSNYKSSIFLCPSLSAVYASSFDEANCLQRSITGKGLSIQAWNIAGKIRQLDTAIDSGQLAGIDLFEAHPEICFARLNNGVFPGFKKKQPEGYAERLSILNRYADVGEVASEFMSRTKRSAVAKDDILDSACLAISAFRAGQAGLETFPELEHRNESGIEMRICLPKA